MTEDEKLELVGLAAEAEEYIEGDTVIITATLLRPWNTPMSDYRSKWTVGFDTPFIYETDFVYHDGNSHIDRGRYNIEIKSNSSRVVLITITIINAMLEDERVLKLTVFNQNLTTEILTGVVTFKVNPRPPLRSSPQLAHSTTTSEITKVS